MNKILSSSLLILLGLGGVIAAQFYLEGESWARLGAQMAGVLTVAGGLTMMTVKKSKWLNFCRIFIGLVFVFSGFVKAVDPLGTVYMMNDYFDAFNLPSFKNFSVVFSVIMISLELIAGLAFLFNSLIPIFSWVILALMAYFTPLTLYLAIANPVHDCGCFGEALIITNWQTFWKNIFLLIPLFAVFLTRSRFAGFANKWVQMGIVAACITLSSWTMFYSYTHDAIIDFRPYKIGTDIVKAMEIPENAPKTEFSTKLFYKNKKDGISKEFAMTELPQDESVWVFDTAITEMTKKGYVPPIHDFAISSEEGEDVTNRILADKKLRFFVIMYDLEKTNIEALASIKRLKAWSVANNLKCGAVTSTSLTTAKSFIKEHAVSQLDLYNADAITLKTIMRSNPGVLALKEGIVVGKWAAVDLPENEELEALLNQSSTQKDKKADNEESEDDKEQ